MSAGKTPLTAERIRFMLNYDPITGDLTWKNSTSNNVPAGSVAGGAPRTNGRRYVVIDGVQHLAHRLAWLHHYGRLPEENVSAKNGNYTDLRIENLVLKTDSEVAGSGARRANSSGFRGVSWDKKKKKWQATITRNYKQVMLGRFATAEEASAAYERAAIERDAKPTDLDGEERRARAGAVALRVELRRKWRRTIKEHGGVVGWDSFETFSADIGGKIPYRSRIAAKNGGKPGPDNWLWVPIDNPQFDYRSPEGKLAAARKHRAENREHYKNKELVREFGITLEQYQEMLLAQRGVCAICGKPETATRRGRPLHLSVDHCHKTKQVRALLCGFCNKGLGKFFDNPDLLRSAATYVVEHTARIEARSASSSNMKTPKER